MVGVVPVAPKRGLVVKQNAVIFLVRLWTKVCTSKISQRSLIDFYNWFWNNPVITNLGEKNLHSLP